MKSYSIVAMFCEDVRREGSGQESIIGTLPDTIQVNRLPGLLGKMALYVRANFAISYKLERLSYHVISPEGQKIQEIQVESDIIKKAFEDAAAISSPMVGLKTMTVYSPVNLTSEGRFEVRATVNRQSLLCGVLNVRLADNQTET